MKSLILGCTRFLGSFVASAGRLPRRAIGRLRARGEHVRAPGPRSVVLTRLVHVAGRATRVVLLALSIAGLTLLAGWGAFHRVPLGSIGVKQRNFGGGGIVAADHPSGLYFSLRGFEAWHEIDGRTQMISFTWSAEPGDAEHLKVRTADGNYVRIGAAVPFRVRPGEAHALVEDGLKGTYRKRVQTAIERTLTSELGRLSTEEFWNTEARARRVADALPVLNLELAPLHVEAQDILIELFWFNPEYEQRQQQVQLDALKLVVAETRRRVEAEQLRIERTEREIARAEIDLGIELKRAVDAEHDAGRTRIEATFAQARTYEQTRKAHADAEFERLVAEGEREVAQAEQLRAAAEGRGYDSRGGRLLLAKQAAENLNIQQVTLNSNDPRSPNVLDLDALVHLLVGATR